MRGVRAFDFDVGEESERLERATPLERVRFAVETFGEKLLFTSSFGTGSAVLLHMWSTVARGAPVVFIDTGFLFKETLAYRDELAARLRLNVRVVRPPISNEAFLASRGQDFPRRDPDACCAFNKVDPLKPLLDEAEAWLSGLRRDQSRLRKDIPIMKTSFDRPIGIYPLASMTAADVDAYLVQHDLPEHPLKHRGYLSVGCEPCTRAALDGDVDERAGRWAWSEKTECGLHDPASLVRRSLARSA